MNSEEEQLVRDALTGEPTWIEAATQLRLHLEEHRDGAVPAIIAAFEYDEIGADQEERRSRWGPFGPPLESAEGNYPTPLPQIDDNTLAIWADAYGRIADPLLRARLADLLWERKVGPQPAQRARSAFDAYMTLADRPAWYDLRRADALIRALELGVKLKDAGRVARAVDRMATVTHESMRAQPGVALHLIATLSRLRSEPQPGLVDALLEEASTVYADDPFNYGVTLNLQLARVRGDQEQRTALVRKKIRSWRERADQSEGILRLTHLQHALEVARAHGLRHEMDELRVALEQTTARGLDLKTIFAGIEIPSEEVDRFLGSFLRDENWEVWLSRFGAYCPIHPTSGQVQRFIEEQMQRTPLQFLFSGIVLSEDHGIPLKLLRSIVVSP